MTVFLLLGVVALVVLNGLFVAAEFALVRSRRSRVEALHREGARGTELALLQMDRLDEYLSACQLGITMASLGIGFLGEPALAGLLEGPLGGVVGHGAAVTIAVAIAYALVTVAHVTVGEQVPKIYAIRHAERTARAIGVPLHVFSLLSRPLVWALTAASRAILRAIGTDPDGGPSDVSDADELRQLIAESAGEGRLDRGEARMLGGVFDLHERSAGHVMTPYPDVVAVSEHDDVETALRRGIDSGHSRLPVTSANGGELAGVVRTDALAALLLERGAAAPVRAVLGKPLLTRPSRPLDELLADLQRARTSLAIVTDERGAALGVVTVEDIVEEIVGEIEDENGSGGTA